MSALLGMIFINPVSLSRWTELLLLLPLCLAISVVYKTTKCADVREVPLAALVSWITIVLGMYAVGIALWLLYEAVA